MKKRLLAILLITTFSLTGCASSCSTDQTAQEVDTAIEETEASAETSEEIKAMEQQALADIEAMLKAAEEGAYTYTDEELIAMGVTPTHPDANKPAQQQQSQPQQSPPQQNTQIKPSQQPQQSQPVQNTPKQPDTSNQYWDESIHMTPSEKNEQGLGGMLIISNPEDAGIGDIADPNIYNMSGGK